MRDIFGLNCDVSIPPHVSLILMALLHFFLLIFIIWLDYLRNYVPSFLILGASSHVYIIS